MNAQEAREIQKKEKDLKKAAHDESVAKERSTIMEAIERTARTTEYSHISRRGFEHYDNIEVLKELGYEVKKIVHEDGLQHYEIHW